MMMCSIGSFVRLRNVASQAVTDITPVDLLDSLEAPGGSQGYV